MTAAIVLVAAGVAVVGAVLLIAYKVVNRLPRDHRGPDDRGSVR